jgi:hypothetical protein
MTDAAERPHYIAALILNGTKASGTAVDMTVIGALDDLDAIENATNWASKIVADREIDSATLQVTRDGLGIKGLPMARLPMGEAANAHRT